MSEEKVFMKKILSILAVSAASAFLYASDVYTQDANLLPEDSRAFISQNFGSEKISGIKIDKDWGFVKDYTVSLSDSTKLEFYRDGDWKSIENKALGVPSKLLPQPMSEYIAKKYPNAKVLELKKKHYGFKVELSSSVELRFDKSGTFLGLDL